VRIGEETFHPRSYPVQEESWDKVYHGCQRKSKKDEEHVGGTGKRAHKEHPGGARHRLRAKGGGGGGGGGSLSCRWGGKRNTVSLAKESIPQIKDSNAGGIKRAEGRR